MSNILHTLGFPHVNPDGQIVIQGVGSMDALTKPLTTDEVIGWLKGFRKELSDGAFATVTVNEANTNVRIKVTRIVEIVIETIEEYQKLK